MTYRITVWHQEMPKTPENVAVYYLNPETDERIRTPDEAVQVAKRIVGSKPLYYNIDANPENFDDPGGYRVKDLINAIYKESDRAWSDEWSLEEAIEKCFDVAIMNEIDCKAGVVFKNEDLKEIYENIREYRPRRQNGIVESIVKSQVVYTQKLYLDTSRETAKLQPGDVITSLDGIPGLAGTLMIAVSGVVVGRFDALVFGHHVESGESFVQSLPIRDSLNHGYTYVTIRQLNPNYDYRLPDNGE